MWGLGYFKLRKKQQNKQPLTNGHIPLCSKMIPRPNLFIDNENETQAAN